MEFLASVLPREARKALGLKPGGKILVVTRGERVILLRKPTAHHAAIRGLIGRTYPGNYLRKERRSWD